MRSADGTGVFNIIGLDAGSYILRETTTPPGYNTCPDIEITIGAVHTENDDGITCDLILTNTNTNNKIINRSGSTLPSTGGPGTHMLYMIGRLMTLISALYLFGMLRRSHIRGQ